MARLFHSGFEQDSSIAWTYNTSQPFLIQAAAARTGSFGLRIQSMTSGTPMGYGLRVHLITGSQYFARVYFRPQTLPSGSNTIFSINLSNPASSGPRLTLESNGTLILRNASHTQVGSPSVALSTGTWYMIELMADRTHASGSNQLAARLNGVVFASTSTDTTTTSLGEVAVGGNLNSEAQTTGVWWFDDLSVNDSTTSIDNTYPGEGRIIDLRPNAAGDANAFPTAVGGTAGQANNYTRVNKVAPSPSVYNQATAANQEDLFNVDASGLGLVSIVSVAVGTYFATAGADATTAVVPELLKTSGGTIMQGRSFKPNSTNFTWNGNNGTFTLVYPILTNVDPDGNPWTPATLDTMQIGYKQTALGTNNTRASQIWATVEYGPYTKPLADTATASDAIVKSVGKTISDSPVATDGRTSLPTINKADSITVTDGRSTANVFLRSLSDSVTILDSSFHQPVKSLSDTVLTSDGITTIRGIGKSLSDSVTGSDANSKAVGKFIADSVTPIDGNDAGSQFLRSDAVTASDALIKSIVKNIADSVVAAEARNITQSKVISDSVTVGESISKRPRRNIGDSVTVLDYVSPVKNLYDQILIQDKFYLFLNGIAVIVPTTDYKTKPRTNIRSTVPSIRPKSGVKIRMSVRSNRPGMF